MNLNLTLLSSLLVVSIIGYGTTNQKVFYQTLPIAAKPFNYFPESERLRMKKKVKDMFYFGYDNYIKYAFPLDELNPIYCSGRGPDKEHP